MHIDESHPWIDNFIDFEAVLQCLNALPDLEAPRLLRAFAVYGWNDVTEEGEDQYAFLHSESGIIIQYESPLIAIAYGEASLCDALPDLFEVLNQIGWREAQVYHPHGTMPQLLDDLGSSIPAKYPLNIVPAPSVATIIETRDLRIAVQELTSNDSDGPSRVHEQAGQPVATRDTQNISSLIKLRNAVITTTEKGGNDLVADDFDQVINIYPGHPRCPFRWDVWAEVQGTTLTKLLETIDFATTDAWLIGCMVLALQSSQKHLQTRDLLTLASSDFQNIRCALLPFGLPSEVLSDARLTQLCDSIFKKLGALYHYPTGQSFFDIKNASGELQQSVLSLPDIHQSSSRSLYIIHLDSIDSAFVKWQIDLLMTIGALFEKSNYFVSG